MAAMALAASLGLPAVAAESTHRLDLSGVLPGLPAPADTGKPAIVPPATAAEPPRTGATHCAPPLPCGTRLLGTVRKNGAVELQVPALRW